MTYQLGMHIERRAIHSISHNKTAITFFFFFFTQSSKPLKSVWFKACIWWRQAVNGLRSLYVHNYTAIYPETVWDSDKSAQSDLCEGGGGWLV